MATTTAGKKKATATPRKKAAPKRSAKAAHQEPLDRLQQAIADIEKVAERVTGEVRSTLDEAMTRVRDAASELRERAEKRR